MKSIICTLAFLIFYTLTGAKNINIELPKKGLCAHRGDMGACPENTLPAFRSAVKAGVQMIEFDVWLTKDKQMVVMHDAKVDRTTNGHGKIADLTFDEIRKLDAGSWKAPEFVGTQVPTLAEVLNEMPYNVWLNIHIKGEGELPATIARLVEKQDRLHQAFLACSAVASRQAKEAVPAIKICNMERQESVKDYIDGTINSKSDFIQLLKESTYTDFTADVKRLKDKGILINYYYASSPGELKTLFDAGVDFPLVNDLSKMKSVALELGIQPVKPIFRKNEK